MSQKSKGQSPTSRVGSQRVIEFIESLEFDTFRGQIFTFGICCRICWVRRVKNTVRSRESSVMSRVPRFSAH